MGNYIDKEIWINAPVEKVFDCFTEEGAMLEWHGKEVTSDPKPGGIYHVTFEDGTEINGVYKEVIPNKKVVYTARYGEVTSTVTIQFFQENGGTTIKLRQEFLPDQDTSSFNNGWDYFLGILQDTWSK